MGWGLGPVDEDAQRQDLARSEPRRRHPLEEPAGVPQRRRPKSVPSNLTMKRGQIWISAVIYIGLGVIAITLLVGAGVPLINKVRDRNTFLQTKEVMQTIDKAIMQVVAEGPGSQRVLSPLEIKKGFLSIPISREITWEMETKAVLQEPGQLIREGNLNLLLTEDELIVDLYDAEIFLNHFRSLVLTDIFFKTSSIMTGLYFPVAPISRSATSSDTSFIITTPCSRRLLHDLVSYAFYTITPTTCIA